MGNFKIRVNSQAESREAQELFFQLGYGFEGNTIKETQEFEYTGVFYLFAYGDDQDLTHSSDRELFNSKPHKEVTLAELRDMVKPMKEYLNKETYAYVKTHDLVSKDSNWIEIPEGAIRARFYPHDPDELEFENAFYQWWHGENKEWTYYADYAGSVEYSRVVWQRTPSLKDQYAEIEQVRDNVNNPQHYNKGGVECIDAIEASMTPEAFKGYLKGNVQKYMWRYEQKGGVESLRKAQWYLERLVASMGS